MGQIEDLRLFVDVVNSGGIGRAADTRNIAKSAVSRRLKLIEDRYGVQLIDRRPGVWDVTDAGQELLHRANRLLTEADEVERDFTQSTQTLAGPLSVSVPREFGNAFLKPALLGFMAKHPEIQLNVDFDDRRVDLDRENYDFAIRITDQIDEHLVSKHLGIMQQRLLASPGYLAQAPALNTLDDLRAHAILNYGSARRVSWDVITKAGARSIEFTPVMQSNSGQFLLDVACAGGGVLRIPDFLSQSAQQTGALVAVLPEVRLQELPLMIAYSKNRLLNRRMRVFIQDMTAACMAI